MALSDFAAFRLLFDLTKGSLWLAFNLLDIVLVALHSVSVVPVKGLLRLLSSAPPTPLRVVVLGQSSSGLVCSRELRGDPRFSLCCIDFKEYFEYTPGILRALVEPGHFWKLSAAIPSGGRELVVGEAVEVTPREVVVQHSGAHSHTTRVPFDVLLAGCGSTYSEAVIKPRPCEQTQKDRFSTILAEHERLQQARSVLIAGAGPVGVELAAEILDALPGVGVTIVEAADRVCGGFAPRSQRYITRWLESHGCQLILGTPIGGRFPNLDIDESGCTLSDGRRYEADVVYKCFGGKAASKPFLKHFGGSGCIDLAGRLLATDTLGLARSHDTQTNTVEPEIYVMGDVMLHEASAELKLGHTAEVNAHLIAMNLRRKARGLSPLCYPEGIVGGPQTPRLYIVSLGKYDASMAFNSLVVNGPVAALLKWILEWSKVQACRERLVGELIWVFGDYASNFLATSVPWLKAKNV